MKLPFFIKASILIVGLYALISMLQTGQDIILPLMYAGIIAIAINPVINKLVKLGVNRTLSIAIVITFVFAVLLGLIFLVSIQASKLGDAWPQLATKFQLLTSQSIDQIAAFTNINPDKINSWITGFKSDLLKDSSTMIGITITTMGGALSTIFLTPVYVFMMLFYQPHLIAFTHKIFGLSNDNNVTEILTETKSIIQNYLVGLFIEFIILSVLNSLGLIILGIEYALLLGVIGAFLNIIPYLGGIIGVVLFMIIAMATKEPIYILYVILLYTFIQLLDNNYIVPKIVGSKVKLNALVSIIVVILGAALWGIPGMFLSIPMTAIIKLLFDRIESTKPWGFLLGDSMPPLIKFKKHTK